MKTSAEILNAARERFGREMAEWPSGAVIGSTKAFVAAFKNVGPFDNYRVVPPQCEQLLSSVEGIDRGAWVPAFLRLAIWQAIGDAVESGEFGLLPARVQRHQLLQFERLLGYEKIPDAWTTVTSDVYLKDFGLATLRLYAAASQVVDLRGGLPRSLLFKSGVRGLYKCMKMLADCGGLKPMLQIHTHTAYLDEFNEAGWEECYRTCADIYRARPDIKGMYGGSWFYDPQLAAISPRLAYLVDTPCKAGAHLIFADETGEFVQDAIATSPTRRQLYESGQYHPRRYALVWSRASQTRWASGHST